MDLKEVEILGSQIDRHWYYVSKASALKQYLSQIESSAVLDIGAGSGYFSKYLLKNTSLAKAVCLDIGYTAETVENFENKTIEYKKSIEQFKGNLVLMMDVLEHVQDDVGLLKSYIAKVPVGTWFLISVPAFNFLFSSHDVFLEHHRRYSRGSLQSCLKLAGLHIHKSHYFFGLLFPVISTIRLLKKFMMFVKKDKAESELKNLPSWLNQLLVLIHTLELHFIFKYNRWAGLTLFCLAQKTESH